MSLIWKSKYKAFKIKRLFTTWLSKLWQEQCSQIIHGNNSKVPWRLMAVILGKTTNKSWKPYCGNCVKARHSVIYRVSYVHGKLPTIALTGYLKKGFGSNFFWPTSKYWWRMGIRRRKLHPLSSAFKRRQTRRASSHWKVSRGNYHQDSSRRRLAWKPDWF